MIDKQCLTCDFYDSDLDCMCSGFDRWYTCPLAPDFLTDNYKLCPYCNGQMKKIRNDNRFECSSCGFTVNLEVMRELHKLSK